MKNYLKILAAATVVMAMTLFMGACSEEVEKPPAEVEVEPGGVELLSGYPEDILPLYKSVKIGSVKFSVRNDVNYVVGKDIYNVSFLSSASAQDTMKYYRGLATSIDEEYSTDYSFDAKVGENPMSMSFFESDKGLEVSLTLGMKPSEYVTVNPYFSDYPTDLIEPFGRATFFEQSYEVREMNGTESIYIETYKTDTNKEEFRAFYSAKYDGAENLNIQEDEYGLTYQWTNGGYTCRASISTYGGPAGDFVTTIANVYK